MFQGLHAEKGPDIRVSEYVCVCARFLSRGLLEALGQVGW